MVGFSGGEIQRIPANHLLVKNVSAVGIYLGGYLKNKPAVVQGVGENVASEASCVESLCEMVETGALHPHLYEAYSLERANEALETMREKKVFGKVILCVNGSEWCVCL